METIGKRIFNIRKELKLNQAEFGDKIGLKSNTISDLENDITNIQPYHIKLLHHIYSVTDNYIFKGQLPMFRSAEPLSTVDEQSTFKYETACRGDQVCKQICDICISLPEADKEAALRMIRGLKAEHTPREMDFKPLKQSGEGKK